MKVYYVTGKNFLGQDVTERIEAENPAQARRFSVKVASHAKVLAAATAADRSKR
jgi:hypothetical protein